MWLNVRFNEKTFTELRSLAIEKILCAKLLKWSSNKNKNNNKNEFEALKMKSSHRKHSAHSQPRERERKKGNLSHKNPYNETKFIEQLIEMLYLLEQLSRTLLNFSTFVLYSIFLCRRFCFSPYLIEFKFRSDFFLSLFL